MYLGYYRLKEDPFSLTPNPDYLFLSEGHKEALARIQFGIEMRKGFVVLTGDVGSGKTTLIRTYIKNQPPNQKISLIVNTRVTAKNLLQNICKDFSIKADYPKLSKDSILNLLYEYILQSSFFGENLVVIIDEAHDLGVTHLEEVRLLTNLETNTNKLLQVVLVGQPELWDLLNTPELRALKQRVQLQYHLEPLTFSDTKEYINHRLSLAGYKGKPLFTQEALQEIFKISKGVPRVINVICSNALALGYGKGIKKIDHIIIKEVTKEFLPKTLPQEKKMFQGKSDRQEIREENRLLPEKKLPRVWMILLFLSMFIILEFVINILSQYVIKKFNLF